MGHQRVLSTREQNQHLQRKPFRWMKKAQGGHEKLVVLGREMKDTATSGTVRATSPTMVPLRGSQCSKAPSLHPSLVAGGGL